MKRDSGPSLSRIRRRRDAKYRPLAAAVLVLALGGLAWRLIASPGGRVARGEDASASSSSASASSPSSATASGASGGHRYPHALRDPAKREELRKRLLVAAADAERAEKAEKEQAAQPGAPPYRGNREANDIGEFGKFAAQAIREDFIPMARACAKDLAARQPDAGGTVRVAFELLGDKSIGGVVNSSEVDGDKSTLHDDKFETCIRESMYGVYFDPPPANARATLNFDVDVKGDGKGTIDEEVEDFHPRDRRGEKP